MVDKSFRYGISYHGASQAASGTKEQVNQYRERNKAVFKSIGEFQRSNRESLPEPQSNGGDLKVGKSSQTVSKY